MTTCNGHKEGIQYAIYPNPAKSKVAPFTGKLECKKYPKAVWNSMSREPQMQVRKLRVHQGIKPTSKQSGSEIRNAALEAQLRVDSQPKTFAELAWGENRGNPVITYQALGGKCKKSG